MLSKRNLLYHHVIYVYTYICYICSYITNRLQKFPSPGMVTRLYRLNPTKRVPKVQCPMGTDWWFGSNKSIPAAVGCLLQSWGLTRIPEQHQWDSWCPRNCWKCFVKVTSSVFPLVGQRFINDKMSKNAAFTLALHPLGLLKTEQQMKNMRKSHLLQTNTSNSQKPGIEE